MSVNHFPFKDTIHEGIKEFDNQIREGARQRYRPSVNSQYTFASLVNEYIDLLNEQIDAYGVIPTKEKYNCINLRFKQLENNPVSDEELVLKLEKVSERMRVLPKPEELGTMETRPHLNSPALIPPSQGTTLQERMLKRRKDRQQPSEAVD
jgi:hypothetical protein